MGARRAALTAHQLPLPPPSRRSRLQGGAGSPAAVQHRVHPVHARGPQPAPHLRVGGQDPRGAPAEPPAEVPAQVRPGHLQSGAEGFQPVPAASPDAKKPPEPEGEQPGHKPGPGVLPPRGGQAGCQIFLPATAAGLRPGRRRGSQTRPAAKFFPQQPENGLVRYVETVVKRGSKCSS